MELKVKKLTEDAIIPTRAHDTDAGLDFFVDKIVTEISEDNNVVLVYSTGIAVEIPEGYVGLLFPRSSISKKSIALCNSVGVIDAGYRGEVIAKFKTNTNVIPAIYQPGDKFIQLVITPIETPAVVEVDELSPSDRGEDGFGSTGTAPQPESTDVTQEPSEDCVTDCVADQA